MNQVALADRQDAAGEIMEAVIAKGDLAKLTPAERSDYYLQVCRSIGLNPLTRPFEYITLNGKLILYARRDAADQLRKINRISIEIVSQRVEDGLLTVHVRATDPSGRTDEDMGVVHIANLKGEVAANAALKAVTKAKRRVTLSISGLGWLDESEVDDIPAQPRRAPKPIPLRIATPDHDIETGEIVEEQPEQSEGLPAEDAPTAAEYAERWETIIEAATNAKQLAAEWNAQKELRNRIAWGEDGSFEALRQRVASAVQFLK